MQEKAKIAYVDPFKIKVPDVRITSDFDPDIEAMFGEDIEKVGIEQPILVGKEGETLWLIDGLHRLQQAKLKGIEKVPCVIREMNIISLQMRNLMSNRLRGKTKVSEEIKVLKDLFETHKISIEELVTKSGMRRERVEQLLKVSTVHPDILKGLEDEKISLCAAYELSNLPDEDSQLRMLAIIEQYDLKCSDVKDAVIEAIRMIGEKGGPAIPGNIPLPTENPQVQCQFCKEMVDIQDASSPIVCKYCYGAIIGSILQAKREMEEAQKIENKKIEDSTGQDIKIEGGG
jgi:ParB/RepB/Spo0J family partition protein